MRGNRLMCAIAHPSSAENLQQKSSPAKAGLQSLRYGINQRLLNFKDLVLTLPSIW